MAQHLLTAGERVYDINPRWTAGERQHARQRGKSDRLDARAVARVVRREAAPPPVATTLFHLTPRGEELRPVLKAMAQWGLPLMGEALEGEAFRSHWLASPVALYLADSMPESPPVTIEVRTGGEPTVIETANGVVRARPGRAPQAQARRASPSDRARDSTRE